MMLEEEIKLHGFAGISPEQAFTEAGRHARRWWPPIRVWSSVVLAMISPASSTMIFMGGLQSNAPVSAAAKARNLSNLVPAPAFQPMKITASVFDMRHIAHRPFVYRQA